MKDKNNVPVSVGMRVRFRVGEDFEDRWALGTVRALGKDTGPWADHVRCDDGDPNNDDMHTNGFHVSAWVRSHEIEVVTEREFP